MNPQFDDEFIYTFFDSVHIFKNIRNCWYNQSNNTAKGFVFPAFENRNELKVGKVEDIRSLYQSEQSMIIKEAFKLNYKTVYPNSLER